MHRLGEIYIERPRSSFPHAAHPLGGAGRVRGGGSGGMMYGCSGVSLSSVTSSRTHGGGSRSDGDRFFRPPSPLQDALHHVQTHQSFVKTRAGVTENSGEIFQDRQVRGPARDLECQGALRDMKTWDHAGSALAPPRSNESDGSLHQSLPPGSSFVGHLYPQQGGVASRGGGLIHANLLGKTERLCKEEGAVRYAGTAASASSFYEGSVESRSGLVQYDSAAHQQQQQRIPDRFQRGPGSRTEQRVQNDNSVASMVLSLGGTDQEKCGTELPGLSIAADDAVLARQQHQCHMPTQVQQQKLQRTQQQFRQTDQRGIDLSASTTCAGDETSATDWRDQHGYKVASRSSMMQIRSEGASQQQQRSQYEHKDHFHHAQHQQYPQHRLHNDNRDSAGYGPPIAAVTRDLDSSRTFRSKHGEHSKPVATAWGRPEPASFVTNGPARGVSQSSATNNAYSMAIDRPTRSPSPGAILYAHEAPRRSFTNPSIASQAHARSLSEGHDRQGNRVDLSRPGLVPDALSEQPTQQRIKGSHTRGLSVASSVGRLQSAFDPGGDEQPQVEAIRASFLHGGVSTTPCSRGLRVALHSPPLHSGQQLDRCSTCTSSGDGTIVNINSFHNCPGSIPSSSGSDRDRPRENAMLAASEQHQQQQRRLVAISDHPGFTRTTSAEATRSPPGMRSGNGVLTPVSSFAAGGLIASSDIATMDVTVGGVDTCGMHRSAHQLVVPAGQQQRGSGGGPARGNKGGSEQGCGLSGSRPPAPPPTPPPGLLPPAPKNPLEWLQRLQRTRVTNDVAPGTPTMSRSSSTSSQASPARFLALGTVARASAAVAAAALAAPFRAAGICPAADCPGTRNCLPGATPDMVVYEVKFKRATRTFLPGELIGENPICCGDRVKVEADRGEDLGIVHRSLPLSEYLQALYEEKQAKAAKIAENGGGGGDGEGGKKKRSKSKKNEEDGGKNASAKTVKQQQQQLQKKAEEAAQEEACPVAAIKRILRTATDKELEQLDEKTAEEAQILRVCQTKVRNRSLPMKIVDAEYQFDRHKLTLFFEAERRIDFRELVRDLFAVYKTRIWMQQVKDKNAQSSASSSADKSDNATATATTTTAASTANASGDGTTGVIGYEGTSSSVSSSSHPHSHHHEDADHDSGYGSSSSSNSSSSKKSNEDGGRHGGDGENSSDSGNGSSGSSCCRRRSKFSFANVNLDDNIDNSVSTAAPSFDGLASATDAGANAGSDHSFCSSSQGSESGTSCSTGSVGGGGDGGDCAAAASFSSTWLADCIGGGVDGGFGADNGGSSGGASISTAGSFASLSLLDFSTTS